MKQKMTDQEVEKLGQEIIELLKDFSKEEQIRILKAVAILHDVKGVFVNQVDIVD
jgi:ATP-dependent protease HslVU (ClpYQ) peptidase subunit